MYASDKAKAAGVELRNWGYGQRYGVCPRCSATRKKKRDPCLSVKIESDKVLVCCHHCQWGDAFHDDERESVRLAHKSGAGPRTSDNHGMGKRTARGW